MNNDVSDNFFWWLAVMANWCQLQSYEMNKKQISNDELLKHLQNQDEILDQQNKVLDEQTNIYLQKILENQNEILKLMKGEK